MIRTSVVALMATVFDGVIVAQGPPAADPPNPYQTIDRWGTLPAGRTWGAISAVDIDRDGRSVWVAERCGGQACADSSLAPILKLDPSGAVVASFGAGLFVVPHGIDVDTDGNVWVTDASDGIGSVTDGTLTAFIPDRTPMAHPITAAEGVAVDADGNVYGAIVPAQMPQKHARR